jgi:signal transduction histidine kinase
MCPGSLPCYRDLVRHNALIQGGGVPLIRSVSRLAAVLHNGERPIIRLAGLLKSAPLAWLVGMRCAGTLMRAAPDQFGAPENVLLRQWSMPLLHPISILLVDDEPRNVVALEAALASVDCNLVTAHSGLEALKFVLAQDFAVIVLDIHMPEVDGFETAGLIRTRERSHSTPIIFLTAYDHARARVLKGYRFGAVDYIYTPFDPEILRAKVTIFVELFRKTAAFEQKTAELTQLTAELVRRRQEDAALNLERVERTTELELASKHKSDFLASMSHELRTPLNAIIGFSEIMLDHDITEISDDQRKTFLDHIHRSAHHLLGLVNDVLDLAKVEAGHLELSLERVPLQDTLVGCVNVIRSVSDPKLLTLVTQCEPADAVVTADAARLNQILYNLLSNAVKFTPTGGQISVTAQVDSAEAVIAVRDSGVGILPEDADLIFQPFRQANAARRTKQEGTGLGLPLVRKLVELHGGRVWMGSAPGVGSCFTFTLPQAQHLEATAETPVLEELAVAT